MKILIIGPGKLKYMPYAHFYLDNIDCINNEVHLAYWNRDEKEEDISSYSDIHLHEYKCFLVNDAPIKEKTVKFYHYRRFCKSLIKQHNFDFIVVLHTLSGLMIYDILGRYFRDKFILDYRDSTHEHNSLFKAAVGNLVKWSKVTFVSSDGFRKFLPASESSKTITSHNLLEADLRHRDYVRNSSPKIRLCFWGFIRYFEINKELINRISDDDRFELHYYGREQKDALDLKKHVSANNIKNVFFHGEYSPSDRYEFVKNTDIIDNIYLNPNTLLAMGNKYYDGLMFRIPQVCFPGSYMAKMNEERGIGIALNPYDTDFCEKLYAYYTSTNQEAIDKNCDAELSRVLEEYNRGKLIVSKLTTI